MPALAKIARKKAFTIFSNLIIIKIYKRNGAKIK
jgi:hypothetical protein